MFDCTQCPIIHPCEICEFGGCEIYPGDPYYFVDGLLLCDSCLAPYFRQWLLPHCHIAGEEDGFCIP